MPILSHTANANHVYSRRDLSDGGLDLLGLVLDSVNLFVGFRGVSVPVVMGVPVISTQTNNVPLMRSNALQLLSVSLSSPLASGTLFFHPGEFMSTTITIDDTDPRIRYSSNWIAAAGTNEFDSTTHVTRQAGAQATFKFTGSSIAVYGTIPDTGAYKDAPVSTYSLDGASSVTFSPAIGSTAQYRQLFFSSPKLSDGEHTLVITSAVDQAYLWLDYFEITPVQSTPSLSATSGITTAPLTMSTSTLPDARAPTTSLAIDPAPNATSANIYSSPSKSATPQPSHNGGPNVGAIVGVVIGAFIIGLLFGIFLLLRRRRRRRAPGIPSWAKPALTPGRLDPFMASSPTDGFDTHSSGSSPSPTIGYGYGYVTHGGTTSEKRASNPSPSPSPQTHSSTGLLDGYSERNQNNRATGSSQISTVHLIAEPSSQVYIPGNYAALFLHRLNPEERPPSYHPPV
ncbi:hypothetical protein H0H81_001085 [Sphagnurus paluster]|uniref:Transmembrane protein n=1 Tax=Sphagnurus paluster TaxID=117069 RepID=A0A9P7GN66_9AGAR|nr:hypothetical protein H0H81_001085 [Sphagnurus paluster]